MADFEGFVLIDCFLLAVRYFSTWVGNSGYFGASDKKTFDNGERVVYCRITALEGEDFSGVFFSAFLCLDESIFSIKFII